MCTQNEITIRNELTRLCYGEPVRKPSPNIQIGDVGYFEEGRFLPLFNILPPDDSTTNSRFPFHHQPNLPALHLPSGQTTFTTNPLRPSVHTPPSSGVAFSEPVEVHNVGSLLRGDISVSFANEKGVVLILPCQVTRHYTLYSKLFKSHMLTYHQQWYDFAVNDLHIDIKPQDLVLVTGCDLSPQCGVIATAWGGVEQQPQRRSDESQEDERQNQCIFIRALSIKRRGSLALKTRGTQEETFMSVLLDYMLEKSHADVVIANDDDLWQYLEAKDPENLREILKQRSPSIRVENNVGWLDDLYDF